ncbi:MAG: C-GCAxxG-C-C family protein [Terracidiphilus sp.]|nr:C-GCAxxG-C-C family protein [Terracidiphilus sp.]
MSKAADRAVELFKSGRNCAQSVYAASGSGSTMSEEQRLAVAVAFGGGMGRTGGTCGALTGALMALGERKSVLLAEDATAGRDAAYADAKELIEEFQAAHGAIDCRELTGCRLDTKEGHDAFAAGNVRDKVCMGLVAFAAGKASGE